MFCTTLGKETTKIGVSSAWHRTEKVAEATGLEPATLGVTSRYSNQLSYASVSQTKAVIGGLGRVVKGFGA